MDAKLVAEGLFQSWCLGLWTIYLVRNSEYRDLLNISKEGLIKFAKFLAVLIVVRFFYFEFLAPAEVIENVRRISDTVPWQVLPGVFWEDACQALPLTIMGMMMSDKKWFNKIYLPLIAVMSVTFGAAHLYEGWWAAIVMSIYIPFTMRLGKKYGFGTIMLCHVAYDLISYLSFNMF